MQPQNFFTWTLALCVPIITGILSWILGGRHSSRLSQRKSDLDEIRTIMDIWREANGELKIEIEALRKQVSDLKDEVAKLTEENKTLANQMNRGN